MKYNNFFLLCLCIIIQSIISSAFPQPYLDPAESIQARVTDLLGRMTLEEKIAQMVQVNFKAFTDSSVLEDYTIGSVLSIPWGEDKNSPVIWAGLHDSVQAYALNNRLGIPLLFAVDAVHGHSNVKGAVIFPHNIGLGCTRDSVLIEQAAQITAKEVAGTGFDWTFAPCIAVPRNEKWGRTYEGFAETPALTGIMSAAAVRGFQGDTLADSTAIIACCKHFVADGGTEGGEDKGDAVMTEDELREIHMHGYQRAIAENVASVMVTFSKWNGVKVIEQKYLLTDVLKDELGFKGILITDYGDINNIPDTNYAGQVATAINAGIDMVMLSGGHIQFIDTLKMLVDSGMVPVSRIDDAVSRILRVKFKKGVFEAPFADSDLTGAIGSTQHRDVARQCVKKSLVLLKNQDSLLPLSKTIDQVYIGGSNADDLGAQCGGWSIYWGGKRGDITTGTSIREAVSNAVPAANINSGVDITGSDVAIIVTGESPYAEWQGDRSTLDLPDSDINLIKNCQRFNVPVVVIIVSGRPMIINPFIHDATAVIAAWLPGTEGDGVADVLFGDNDFSGKMSHSWPANMSQIPINAGDSIYTPLFEYGFGLGYNTPDTSSTRLELLLDMRNAIRKGVFNPASDDLDIYGDFNDQHASYLHDDDADSIYTLRLTNLDHYDTLVYYYRINNTLNPTDEYKRVVPLDSASNKTIDDVFIVKAGLEDVSGDQQYIHYDNKQKQLFIMNTSDQVVIMDVSGKILTFKQHMPANSNISLNGFRPGIYIISLSRNTTIINRKIVVY